MYNRCHQWHREGRDWYTSLYTELENKSPLGLTFSSLEYRIAAEDSGCSSHLDQDRPLYERRCGNHGPYRVCG